jgi:hypothetical protein
LARTAGSPNRHFFCENIYKIITLAPGALNAGGFDSDHSPERGTATPGIDFTKLHFGRKRFGKIFIPLILKKFPPKIYEFKFTINNTLTFKVIITKFNGQN